MGWMQLIASIGSSYLNGRVQKSIASQQIAAQQQLQAQQIAAAQQMALIQQQQQAQMLPWLLAGAGVLAFVVLGD